MLEFHNFTKGQIISKVLLASSNSPKKRLNEFVFNTMTNSFVCFLGEFQDPKKSFRNYLTFKKFQFPNQIPNSWDVNCKICHYV